MILLVFVWLSMEEVSIWQKQTGRFTKIDTHVRQKVLCTLADR